MASIAVHVGVVLAALYVSAGPRVAEKPDGAVLRFVMPAPPPPPLPARASEPSKARSEPKKPTPPKDTLVPTKPVPPKAVEESSSAPPSSELTSQTDGHGTGDAPTGTGGDPTGKAGGEPGAPPATSPTTVLSMLPGMERPSILTRGTLTYSREAMAARSEGTAIARCVVNLDGSLSDCRITKSVPFMDRPILEMLEATRYSCVMYQGHCQRVEMVIPVRVAPPR